MSYNDEKPLWQQGSPWAMMNNDITLRPAQPDDADRASVLLYSAYIHRQVNYPLHEEGENRFIERLQHYFREVRNRFSYQFIQVAEQRSEVVGLVLSFGGREEERFNAAFEWPLERESARATYALHNTTEEAQTTRLKGDQHVGDVLFSGTCSSQNSLTCRRRCSIGAMYSVVLQSQNLYGCGKIAAKGQSPVREGRKDAFFS